MEARSALARRRRKSPEQDIPGRSVSRKPSRKTRVEQTSSGFQAEHDARPRRNSASFSAPRRWSAAATACAGSGTPGVGQSMPEEDAMTTASNAMGKAVTLLDALNTTDAMPHQRWKRSTRSSRRRPT